MEKIRDPMTILEHRVLIHRDVATVILPDLHQTYWVDFTAGSPDWTVRLYKFTVHAVPARIMQL